jgi:mRNA interferase YafQ
MLIIVTESRFEKDFKLARKRNKDLQKLELIIKLLARLQPLPARNRNHKLQGNYSGYWECHIEPDWLLIYRTTKKELVLVRTGSHSDLF